MPSLSPLVANALLLATCVLLYAFAWYSVGELPRAIRALARLALASILIVPIVLFLFFGAEAPLSKRTEAPAPEAGSGRSVTLPTAPPPVARPAPGTAPPPPPVVVAPAPVPAPVTASPSPQPQGGESADWHVVPVFYGTDRARATDNRRIKYGPERAGQLDLGRVHVTVPKTHQMPFIERPWALRVPFFDITLYEQAEDPKKHFTVKEIKALTREDFLAEVRARLATSKTFEQRAFVFIHGYNTEFDYAVYRTAQIAYDLEFDGAAFVYSWPANGSATSYLRDVNSAEQSEPFLRSFLDMVVRESGAKSVSLIAHSMGNLPLLRVLRELGPSLPLGVKLDQIILAAPDVDRGLFQQLARDINRVSNGVTLYAASNDRAMMAARTVAGVPRAGDVPPDGPVVMAGIDTIDVSATSNASLTTNHSLYAERDSLMKDIAALLKTGMRPPDLRQPNLRRVPTANGDYWRYPEGR